MGRVVYGIAYETHLAVSRAADRLGTAGCKAALLVTGWLGAPGLDGNTVVEVHTPLLRDAGFMGIATNVGMVDTAILVSQDVVLLSTQGAKVKGIHLVG